MKYAIIENGIVTNIALANAPLAENWIDATGAQIGWLWDGQSFVPPAPPPVTPDQVNVERDRRLNNDFTFAGVLYNRDRISIQRINGAATLAGFAMAQGVGPGNLRWANPDVDFGWIASDGSVTPMDAMTCFAFGAAAARVETQLIFAAKALREMDPIPQDYTDDRHWP